LAVCIARGLVRFIVNAQLVMYRGVLAVHNRPGLGLVQSDFPIAICDHHSPQLVD
jgi:hypothetical protein